MEISIKYDDRDWMESNPDSVVSFFAFFATSDVPVRRPEKEEAQIACRSQRNGDFDRYPRTRRGKYVCGSVFAFYK